MSHRRLLSALAAGALATGALLGAAPAATATEQGTTSLASVLLADQDEFDRNWYDFDVVTQAVLTVLEAKPGSPVAVLTDGTTPLTAFLPNDRAFQVLVKDLTGRWPHTEQQAFAAVAALGVDTVEAVLLYHVVPGATIDFRTALRSDGARLATAQGGTVTVDVLGRTKLICLKDADRNDIDPFVVLSQRDINKGNAQIAHGITFVLRPVDL